MSCNRTTDHRPDGHLVPGHGQLQHRGVRVDESGRQVRRGEVRQVQNHDDDGVQDRQETNETHVRHIPEGRAESVQR